MPSITLALNAAYGSSKYAAFRITSDHQCDLDALATRALLELQATDGETLIINPEQVKVLQNSGEPEPFATEQQRA